MTFYQLALLGEPEAGLQKIVEEKLKEAIACLGMTLGKEVTLHTGPDAFQPFPKLSTAALYFGREAAPVHIGLQTLIHSKVPIVPVASTAKQFGLEIPPSLQPFNGAFLDQANADRLVTILLECAGLLPRQRRVFISYKQSETRNVALQLFEALSSRRFDVFLDTHGIAVGVDFQEELWHRLSDSDVVLMLDSPGYLESRWTRAELGRTLAKQVGVLRVGWPGHDLDRRASLARNLPLSAADFTPENLLTENAIKEICTELESTRTTSIALRYLSLAEQIEQGLLTIGGTVLGIGQRRRMAIQLPNGENTFAFPVLGIPSSVTMQEAIVEGHENAVAVIYNHLGVRQNWLDHMAWLGEHIQSVRWVRESEAAWSFADWEK
ncbi:MAG TPA: toll/interleukin-1 receptor domain-containing protein [Noviherbaspirillum sp.]|nr:toll/interleukin-1 receptor domain-containing protein [Noviherbaspirillum sp.]